METCFFIEKERPIQGGGKNYKVHYTFFEAVKKAQDLFEKFHTPSSPNAPTQVDVVERPRYLLYRFVDGNIKVQPPMWEKILKVEISFVWGKGGWRRKEISVQKRNRETTLEKEVV
jgi:hypothetical protein